MLEKDFQKQIIDLAHHYGWLIAHFRPAQNAKGRWRTPVGADGTGYPDLTLVHPTRGIIFWEVKSEKGKPSTQQTVWLDALSVHVEARIVRPADWDYIQSRLAR